MVAYRRCRARDFVRKLRRPSPIDGSQKRNPSIEGFLKSLILKTSSLLALRGHVLGGYRTQRCGCHRLRCAGCRGIASRRAGPIDVARRSGLIEGYTRDEGLQSQCFVPS